MKKLFVSTGLAAIGLAGIQASYGDGLDIVSPKAWSIAGTLRGFYDDNYNISHTSRGSWGTEFSPTVSLNVPLRQTDMGIRYTYGLYYYNDRDNTPGLNPFDQSHQVDVWLDHAINENWKLNFTDTFSAADQPDLMGTVGPGSTPTTFRSQSSYIANHANISLDTQWTKMFSTSLHYGNDFYSYQNSGTGVGYSAFSGTLPGPFTVLGNGAHPDQMANLSGNGGNGASLAGLLDRVEQNVGIDFQWTFSPETMVFFGYTFSMANYLGNEPIGVFNYLNPAAAVPVINPNGQQSFVYNSNSRDSTSHEAHIGIDHQITANLSVAATAGASYTDNSNDPFQHYQVVSPTANLSATYTYLPDSYVQFGVTQAHNATDVVQPDAGGGLTQYQDTTAVYADLNHKLTEKLIATIIGRYQYSSFQGGANSSQTESLVDASVNLTYQISRHFSADAGYNFDDLFSGVQQRGFAVSYT